MGKEFLEQYQPLFEMANIDEIKGLKIKVYGSDHGYPNFHVIKKGEFEVEFRIPDDLTFNLENLGYKIHNRDIKRKEEKTIQDWLGQANKKLPSVTNLDYIKAVWESLKPTVD